jgi:putative hydrolases of HD superfamily
VEAMNSLITLLPGPFSPNAQVLQELFDEYEAGTTQESILVKDVDKYELLVQAVEYEMDTVNRGDKLDGLKDLTTFFGVSEGLQTDLVKSWADEVMKERERLWKSVSNVTIGMNGV